ARAEPASPLLARIAGLYALTPDLLDTDELVARVAAAIAGGAAAVQYRNKIASPPLRRAQALALRDLCAAQSITFIVNDDVNLAYAVDADGVHLGRDDSPIVRARQRLGATAIIGASCYGSLESAAAAWRRRGGFAGMLWMLRFQRRAGGPGWPDGARSGSDKRAQEQERRAVRSRATHDPRRRQFSRARLSLGRRHTALFHARRRRL